MICPYCARGEHALARHDWEPDCECAEPRCSTDDAEGEELSRLAEAGFFETFFASDSAALFAERVFDLGIEFPIYEEVR